MSRLLLVLSLAASIAVGVHSCRTIALSGGGAFGAYEAGVMSGLIDYIYDGQANWTRIAGISAGSINSAYMTMWNVGDEKSGVESLKTMWLNTTQDMVYKNWPGSYVEGLLLQSGLYDTSPLRAYLTANLDVDKFMQSDRDWIVGATNMDTGDYTPFNKTSIANPVDAVMASSAWPVFFPHVQIGEHFYSDGGAKVNVPILDAFTPCTTEIDVIICSADSMDSVNASTYNTISSFMRTLDILERDVVEKDLQLALLQQQLKDVKIRIVRPSGPLPGGGLTFNKEYTQQMIDIGIQDAKNSKPQTGAELAEKLIRGEIVF